MFVMQTPFTIIDGVGSHARIQRGVRTTPEKSIRYRFLSSTGPDTLINHKATKPSFNVRASLARQRNAIFVVF